MNLGETYPEVLFKILGHTYGFSHYNSGVPCGPNPFLTSALSISAAVVLFEGLYYRISWALSCCNYRNCAKTRRRLCFDYCSHWILIISRKVSLTVTLEPGILTSLRITVTLGQWLEQTALTYHLHRNHSTFVILPIFTRP